MPIFNKTHNKGGNMLSIQKIGDTTGTVCITADNEKYTVEVWTPDKTRTYTYSIKHSIAVLFLLSKEARTQTT